VTKHGRRVTWRRKLGTINEGGVLTAKQKVKNFARMHWGTKEGHAGGGLKKVPRGEKPKGKIGKTGGKGELKEEKIPSVSLIEISKSKGGIEVLTR